MMKRSRGSRGAMRTGPNQLNLFARRAGMFAAMGSEVRLRILGLLIAAHPHGMTSGDIADALDMAGSTLSHHLAKLRNEAVVVVRREGSELWHSVNAQALGELQAFLRVEQRAVYARRARKAPTLQIHTA